MTEWGPGRWPWMLAGVDEVDEELAGDESGGDDS
jgi:hypothetical protein